MCHIRKILDNFLEPPLPLRFPSISMGGGGGANIKWNGPAYLDSPSLSWMLFGSVDNKEMCRIREIFENSLELPPPVGFPSSISIGQGCR